MWVLLDPCQHLAVALLQNDILARRYRHIDSLPNTPSAPLRLFDLLFSLSATSPPPLMHPSFVEPAKGLRSAADFSGSRQAHVVPRVRVQILANACIPLAGMWCDGVDNRQEGSIARVQH